MSNPLFSLYNTKVAATVGNRIAALPDTSVASSGVAWVRVIAVEPGNLIIYTLSFLGCGFVVLD